MNTDELMLNDYVFVNNGIIVRRDRIIAIGAMNVTLSDGTICNIAKISPIPLDDELLKHIGYTDCDSDFDRGIYHYYPGEDNHITHSYIHIGHHKISDTYNFSCRDNTIVGIKYLHELQHAYKAFKVPITIDYVVDENIVNYATV